MVGFDAQLGWQLWLLAVLLQPRQCVWISPSHRQAGRKGLYQPVFSHSWAGALVVLAIRVAVVAWRPVLARGRTHGVQMVVGVQLGLFDGSWATLA